jgi:hypothetical protein
LVVALARTGTAAAQDDHTTNNFQSGGGGGSSAAAEIVQAYQDAVNQHDLDAAMALFAEDAVLALANVPTFVVGEQVPLMLGPGQPAPFLVVNMTPMTRHAQIRAYHEYLVGVKAQLAFEDCLVDDDTVG